MTVHVAMAAALMGATVLGAEPTVEQLLKKYDEVMGPQAYEAQTQMTATRDDGSTRTYVMRFLKKDADKFRVWFLEPSSAKGQEILRNGDNMWVYLPNLKRPTRLANRENFQGGDFNNADVLRVNYSADYSGELAPSTVEGTFLLKLKAKSPETAYDAISLYLRKSDWMPVRGEYYGTSGRLLRSADFTDFQEFDTGYVRPSRVVMKNEVNTSRKSEMKMVKLKLNPTIVPQQFTQGDLGR